MVIKSERIDFVFCCYKNGSDEILLEQELVEMKWSNTNKRKYIEKGYKYTFNGDSFLAKAVDVYSCSSGAKIPVICDWCGKIYYPTSRNYSKSHTSDERDCCVSCKGKKIKETVNAKYGVNNVMQVKAVKLKHEQTCVARYGTFSPLENKEIYEKTQKSFNKHYNTNNGIKDLRSVEQINDKICQTNIVKYGGISPFCSSSIRESIKETMYRNGTCPTSKKQNSLANMIELIYGNCELNYPCDELSLDCMVVVNNTKIDIEYDGWYWHKNRTTQDLRRDFFVESKGYKVIRFVAYEDRLPTVEELKSSIDYILTTDKTFIRTELNKI